MALAAIAGWWALGVGARETGSVQGEDFQRLIFKSGAVLLKSGANLLLSLLFYFHVNASLGSGPCSVCSQR